MKLTFRRLAAVVAGCTVATAGLATTALAGVGNYVTPGSGTVTTTTGTITLTPPGGFGCSANAGDPTNPTQASTYFAASSVVTSSINFNWGATAPTTAPFQYFLKDTTGVGVNGIFPAGTSAPFPVAVPTLRLRDLAGNPAITTGSYKIGVACFNANTGVIDGANFAESPIFISNVTATGFTWAYGAPASAATLGAVTNGDTTATVAFTVPAPTPALTTYTVSVAGATRALTAGEISGGLISLSGLTNGTTYPVTLTVSNGVGSAATSNSVNVQPNLASITGITALTVTGAAQALNLGWQNPASPQPTSYLVSWTPTGTVLSGAVAGSATITGLASTYSITGLVGNQSYSVTVTPSFAVPNPVVPPSVTGSGTALPNTVILQDITVNRPNGLLVMTQRCGVNGPIAAEGPQRGFPNGIPATTGTGPQSPANGPQVGGIAPSTSASFYTVADATDPAFANVGGLSGYPYPQDSLGNAVAPFYPTRCLIDLKNAALVTTGANAGQFFAASGQLNEISVVNTQDSDAGWSVNASSTDFIKVGTTGTGKNKFSADFLGFTPVVDYKSSTLDTNITGPALGYGIQVTAGPGTVQGNAGGLSTSTVVASSPLGNSLGIAQLDGRLKLIIPINAMSGTYHATMTFSAVG